MRLTEEHRQAMLEVIEQWQQSGLSQKEFYQQRNIPAHVFYYWHKYYRRQKVKEEIALPSSSNDFVQMHPAGLTLHGSIELLLPNGKRLIFHPPVHLDCLKDLTS